jgi:hypothetical protein
LGVFLDMEGVRGSIPLAGIEAEATDLGGKG